MPPQDSDPPIVRYILDMHGNGARVAFNTDVYGANWVEITRGRLIRKTETLELSRSEMDAARRALARWRSADDSASARPAHARSFGFGSTQRLAQTPAPTTPWLDMRAGPIVPVVAQTPIAAPRTEPLPMPMPDIRTAIAEVKQLTRRTSTNPPQPAPIDPPSSGTPVTSDSASASLSILAPAAAAPAAPVQASPTPDAGAKVRIQSPPGATSRESGSGRPVPRPRSASRPAGPAIRQPEPDIDHRFAPAPAARKTEADSLPVLDTAMLDRYLQAHAALLERLIESFLAAMPQAMAEANALLAQERIRGARTVIHNMSLMAASIGAARLAHRCESLHRQLDPHTIADTPGIDDQMKTISRELRDVRDLLGGLRSDLEFGQRNWRSTNQR